MALMAVEGAIQAWRAETPLERPPGPSLGRPPVVEGDAQTLLDLRAANPGSDCRAEFEKRTGVRQTESPHPVSGRRRAGRRVDRLDGVFVWEAVLNIAALSNFYGCCAPRKYVNIGSDLLDAARIRIPMSDVEIHEQRAERGREIIAQVRELEAEDKARYEAFAATIKSQNKKYVHRRDPPRRWSAQRSTRPIRASCCGEAIVRSSSSPDRALRRRRSSRARRGSFSTTPPTRRGTPDKRRRNANASLLNAPSAAVLSSDGRGCC